MDDRRGLLGQRAYDLPIGVVAAADDERVELKVPLVDAKAQACTEEPADEPIFGESAPIPPEAMGGGGIPEPERAEVGVGEDAEETERVRRAKGME